MALPIGELPPPLPRCVASHADTHSSSKLLKLPRVLMYSPLMELPSCHMGTPALLAAAAVNAWGSTRLYCASTVDRPLDRASLS